MHGASQERQTSRVACVGFNSKSLDCAKRVRVEIKFRRYVFYSRLGRSKRGCVAIFIITYLSGWLLQYCGLFCSRPFLKTLRCQQESIAKFSFLFHLVSWIVPVVQIFIILLRHEVDANGVIGLCFTGLRNTNINQKLLEN